MDLKLAQEFEDIKAKHKYRTIVSSLILFHPYGIYESSLLKDYEKPVAKYKEDTAFDIADSLLNKAINESSTLYDEVYEMCWLRLRDRISDTVAYGLTEK